MASATSPSSAPVGRQIALPLSKALEIAYKNIRMRLSRSLLVTSGIVLALAFLMAIRTSDAGVDGMRQWLEARKKVDQVIAAGGKPDNLTPYEQNVYRQAQAIQQKLQATTQSIASHENNIAKGAKATFTGDILEPKNLGIDVNLDDFKKEMGGGPLFTSSEAVKGTSAGDIKRAISANKALADELGQWVSDKKKAKDLDAEKRGAANLQVLLDANGVPTDPKAISDSKTQTTWLLALALLVAFVGILNAMLMSVTERFREIGTMKCLGALDGFIVKLFLLESLFQGIIGTVIGIVVGAMLSLGAAYLTYGHFALDNLPLSSVLASAGLCALVGVGLTVAGAVYPAWQAARMQPIEAMRVDT